MHRFRKKSDAKRAQVPEHLLSGNSSSQQPTLPNQSTNTSDALPALPPASDFRTSLILPSLSKRFTLLRTSNGDPISLNEVRSKFAEQRARGAEFQVSEEEEDMIVEALGEIQAASAAEPYVSPTPSNTAAAFSPGADSMFATQEDMPHHSAAGDLDSAASISSGITPSIASTPSSVYPRSIPSSTSSRTANFPRYSSRRHSNNLFGSGRFHDTSYIHSVNKVSVGSRSATPLVGSDSQSGSVRSAHSVREVESHTSQTVTSHADTSGGTATAPDKLSPVKAYPNTPLSALPSRMSKEFSIQQVRRTSLALEEVIRGIEEEAEETIMVPRTSTSRFVGTNSTSQSPKNVETTSTASTPIPWMTDEARVDDRDEDEPAPATTTHPSSPPPSPATHSRPGTTSPTPRLPGYIPGMTRPLTPRDVDSDDGATGYSTTPRARSPAQPQYSYPSNHNHSLTFSASRHHQASPPSEGQSILPPSILRRGSTQVSPLRTTSPGLGGRSRGSSASSPLGPSPVPSPGLDDRNKSDILTRRPLSPFTGAVAGTGYGGSGPGTPSGVVPWSTGSPLSQIHTIQTSAHENDSARSQIEGHGTSPNYTTDSPTQKDTMRGIESADFPAFGSWGHSRNSNQNFNNGTMNLNGPVGVHRDPSVSSIDLGQTVNSRPSATAAKIAARAPTPVHTHPRSPTFNESGNGHDSILLNRSVSKRVQRRMTPPPHIQALTHAPLMLHTPSSSSNSSSNVNLNHHSTSPLFSPILNTSASSLLSAGSSYHSWENENIKKSGWDQLLEHDSQRSAWQEILHSGTVGASETDDASETEAMGSPEQVLRTLTGLTKSDLAALQKKLVADALPRKSFDPPRSPTRRRRISASRTSLSVAQSGRESGTNSPAPPPRQATPVTEQSLTPSPESRRTALLTSVLNSIQPPSATPPPVSTPASSDTPSIDPPTSTDEASSNKFTSASSNGDSCNDLTSALKYKALAEAIEGNEKVSNDSSYQINSDPLLSDPPQSQEDDSGEGTEVPLSQSWRSSPALLPSGNSVQLVRDVSRKTAEATAALKSSSQAKLGEADGTLKRRPTKRIDLQQISSPQLVSSSTSVNAIPIIKQHASPQSSFPASDPRSSLKLSQRFKKLRGSLRTKPTSRDGEEGTSVILPSPTGPPSSLHRVHSPVGPSQSVVYMQQQHVPPASATENGRFKVPVPSPPASAGPGLKGFMARFRKPKKDKEVGSMVKDHSGHQSLDSTSSMPPTRDRMRQGYAYSPPSTATSRPSEDYTAGSTSRVRSPTPDPATVNRLFDAASQLGLDRRAIDELLARSTSTSSRNTTRTRASTAAFADISSNLVASRPVAPRAEEDASLDRARTPDQAYKPTPRPNVLTNQYPEGEIVRRTIIFASDNPSTTELNGSNWKESTSGRPQRAPSATSFYSTASGSATRGPPVPRLPAGLGRTQSVKPSDSSSSYGVYSQEQSFNNGSAESSPENPSAEENEHGPALEVLHLSNGQVVWSVLDSLRAEDNDDTGSLFRRSMASSRGNDVSEDMEVRFKEHRRWDSKGSSFSLGSHNSRRRQLVPSGPRPETKLYKTDSSTIGRLIEDLSRNMDSGSFSFMRPGTAASTATSFHSDTSGPSSQVERELEALLNAINPRPAP